MTSVRQIPDHPALVVKIHDEPLEERAISPEIVDVPIQVQNQTVFDSAVPVLVSGVVTHPYHVPADALDAGDTVHMKFLRIAEIDYRLDKFHVGLPSAQPARAVSTFAHCVVKPTLNRRDGQKYKGGPLRSGSPHIQIRATHPARSHGELSTPNPPSASRATYSALQ
jgi:hypothetical protein